MSGLGPVLGCKEIDPKVASMTMLEPFYTHKIKIRTQLIRLFGLIDDVYNDYPPFGLVTIEQPC